MEMQFPREKEWRQRPFITAAKSGAQVETPLWGLNTTSDLHATDLRAGNLKV